MATIEYLGTDKPVNRLQPKVSICITAYQHAPYIGQCLESVLAQNAGFPYEVLLGEDDSSDGTRNICIAYADRHPDRIRLFLHDRKDNYLVAGKPTGKKNFLHNLRQSRGEYLAFCDGDDYWTSPHKISRQVHALESRPDAMLCFHASHFVRDGDEIDGRPDEGNPTEAIISSRDILQAGGGIVPMNTMMIRRQLVPYLIEYCEEVGGMHFFIRNLGAACSPGGVIHIPSAMGCYRQRSSGSVMSSLINTKAGKYEWTKRTLRMLDIVDTVSQKKYESEISDIKRRLVLSTMASGYITPAQMAELCRRTEMPFASPRVIKNACFGGLRSIRLTIKHLLTRGAHGDEP